jgi:predicted transcriptional regulator of viral defense system
MDRKTQVLEIVKEKGVIKAGDIEAEGISRSYLYVLHNFGLLQKITRGLYALPDTHVSEHITLIEIAKRVPKAVVCLISALSFYDPTTQLPHEVWITIPRGAWRPKTDYPSLNLTYASKDMYSYGVLEHKINGISVKIYSPAKTIADCFKFRNKIGLDVAIEALKKGWKIKKVDMDELVKAAKICKMSKVIRPYLETIV